MNAIRRSLRAEKGIALITVMMAIFILTIVVAAMAVATMGETVLSQDQLRGQQALAIAEAGAYRALAELRRRLAVDLDLRIRQVSVNSESVRNICQSGTDTPPVPGLEVVSILTDYAYPASLESTDWEQVGGTALLRIGTVSSPIRTTDRATGAHLGDFYATIAVRWSGRPSSCQFGTHLPEMLVMWFDYAIQSVGRIGNASRTVCLRSQNADRCTNWFPTVSANWRGSYALSSETYFGWPVLIEKASFSQWSLMLLDVGSVWLYTGTEIYGPVHSNNRIRIAGNPALYDIVTQVEPDMRFLNCGSPTSIPIPASNPNGTLRTSCDNTTGNVFRSMVIGSAGAVPTPSSSNPSRTSVGLTPSGPDASDSQVRGATSDDEYFGIPSGGALPDGIYVMDSCGTPGCGGIYVKGDVQQMVLSSEGGMQVIRMTVVNEPQPARRNMKIVINPLTKAVTTYWGYQGGDSWTHSRSYPIGTFNGVFYINGAITSIPNPAVSSGLYGVVNKDMRLTIATQNELRITDHLVYESPPAGPGHNPTNVLGLYSVTNNVTIVGALADSNIYVDAVVLAPLGKFWVEGWDGLTGKGNVYSLGGVIQATFGEFGRFDPMAGYGRVMTYDWRLRSNVAPPFFPLTDHYTAVRWPSPALVFATGDPLYDRPAWEEMVGQ